MKLNVAVLFLTLLAVGCGYGSNYNSTTGTMAVAPAITTISPSSTTAGGPDFTMTVNGSNFSGSPTVYMNGTLQTTTVVSSSQLTVPVSASMIANAATIPVYVQTTTQTVYNGSTSNSTLKSNSVTFTVN
jgi:hypothetical protein